MTRMIKKIIEQFKLAFHANKKNNKEFLILIIMISVLFSLVGCITYDDKKNFLEHSLTYIKDDKTGLCFAVVSEPAIYSISNVPCTLEVNKLIKK